MRGQTLLILTSSYPWQTLWARIARRLLSPQLFG